MKSLAGESAPEPPQAHTLPPGLADHEDYEMIRELASGGMGVVYLIENKLMGCKEVLKVAGSHLINRPSVEQRFLREIRSAARLHHTNIVTAYTTLRFGNHSGDDTGRALLKLVVSHRRQGYTAIRTQAHESA